MNFAPNAKLTILDLYNDKENGRQEIPTENIKNFLIMMTLKKVEYLKKNYRQLRQAEIELEEAKDKKNEFEAKLGPLTYFPNF